MAIANTSKHPTELFLMAAADPELFSKTFLLGACGLRSDVKLSQQGSFARDPEVRTDSTHTDSPTPKI